MIGVLAAKRAPGLFGKLVLVSPSARYIDDEGYSGGFSAKQIEELLKFLESNHMGWSTQMKVVHGETRQDEFELWVANSGEPIPEKAMDKLFEPFFEAMPTPAGKDSDWAFTSPPRSQRLTEVN